MTPPLSRGSIVLFALIVSAAIMAGTVAFFGYYGSAVKAERVAVASTQALSLAEAGIDKAIYELNQNGSYSGETNTALGKGTFTVSVSSVDSSNKRVTVTGYVPNSARPTATRTVEVTANIDTTVVSFRYGVQIGAGGLSMDNNSQVTGNVFSNGNISGSGTITGDATVAGGTALGADQQWTVQNSGFTLGDTSSHTAVAQSFIPSLSEQLNKVSLYLKKASTPGDITIRIVSDNAGSPSSNVLATGSVLASAVTGSYSYVDGSFSTNPNLVEGEQYWIIASASVNATKYFTWGDDTAAGYTSGAPKYGSAWNTSAWSVVAADMDFKTYMGGNVTSLSGVSVGGNAWAHSLSSCSVAGDASYQTISSCSVSGTRYAGSADASPDSLPVSDAQISDWEDTATGGGTLSGPYTVSGSQTLGPRTINGNLTVTGTLILSGPVWVKGNISFSNGASLSVAASAGASGAVLIADVPGSTATLGTVDLSNNVTLSGNGNANSFPMILSTNSGNSAISFSNNGSGVILYASQGTVDMSNNAGANQITAFKLHLNNNANVTYQSGLQSSSFSNGPGGSWAILRGSYAITQ